MYYCTEVHGGVVSGRQGLTTKKLGRAEGTEGTQGRAGHDCKESPKVSSLAFRVWGL